MAATSTASTSTSNGRGGGGDGAGKSDDKREDAERRNRLHRQTKDLRGRLAKAEAKLMAAEEAVAAVQQDMAEPGAFDDPDAARRLSLRHSRAKELAQVLTAEWESLVEELDAAEAATV